MYFLISGMIDELIFFGIPSARNDWVFVEFIDWLEPKISEFYPGGYSESINESLIDPE